MWHFCFKFRYGLIMVEGEVFPVSEFLAVILACAERKLAEDNVDKRLRLKIRISHQ